MTGAPGDSAAPGPAEDRGGAQRLNETAESTLLRDLRVLARIVLVVVFYWTLGSLVRRRYRRLAESGGRYVVDRQQRGLWQWQRDEDIQ